jgi:amino acid transporter
MLVNNKVVKGETTKEESFPKTLAEVHKSRKTPWIAIIIAMVSTMITIDLS